MADVRDELNFLIVPLDWVSGGVDNLEDDSFALEQSLDSVGGEFLNLHDL